VLVDASKGNWPRNWGTGVAGGGWAVGSPGKSARFPTVSCADGARGGGVTGGRKDGVGPGGQRNRGGGGASVWTVNNAADAISTDG